MGFVKTSFSSPSLPFRIGGYAPGKNSQLPSFTHPPRTSTLRSRRIQKRSKAAFRKSQHTHKGKRFFSSLPGLVPCPIPAIESVKGSCTRLCEKSDKKLGRNAQLPPSFLFFSPLFSENNAIHQSVSRGGDTKHLRQQRKHAHKRNCTRPTFLRKTNDGTTSRCRFCAQPIAKLTCVSPPPFSFVRAQKKQLPIFRWIAVRKDVGAEGFEPPTLCL